jgi:hypothetical protein
MGKRQMHDDGLESNWPSQLEAGVCLEQLPVNFVHLILLDLTNTSISSTI